MDTGCHRHDQHTHRRILIKNFHLLKTQLTTSVPMGIGIKKVRDRMEPSLGSMATLKKKKKRMKVMALTGLMKK